MTREEAFALYQQFIREELAKRRGKPFHVDQLFGAVVQRIDALDLTADEKTTMHQAAMADNDRDGIESPGAVAADLYHRGVWKHDE